MMVPMTTLIATTTSETPTVNFRAAIAWGLVMALQKLSHPLSNAPSTSAANGIRTITLM